MALRTVELHILIALASGARHGYAILQDAQRRDRFATVSLEAGTLYRALRRLRAAGLVDEVPTPASVQRDGDDDERRRYYGLTAAGRKAATAEAQRLAAIVGAARAGGLLGRAKA